MAATGKLFPNGNSIQTFFYKFGSILCSNHEDGRGWIRINDHGSAACLGGAERAVTTAEHRAWELVSSMSHCMYLKNDLRTFSDGSVLFPAFGEGEAYLCPPEVESLSMDLRWKPLHPLYANATAFWGRMAFDFEFSEWPERLVIGGNDRRTTVKEYVNGLDAWCRSWRVQEPDTAVTSSMQETFMGWRLGKHDFRDNCTVYRLK